MRRVRGARIGLVLQEPMTALNPVYTVGSQIAEALEAHDIARGKAARERAIELLDAVRVPAPDRRVDEYPHQLSGGLRQRVLIAAALACGPALLIADEPTTALDVTIQAEILDLLRELRTRFDLALLLITHDLGIVAHNADRVLVMYAGRVVEEAPVRALFREPRHPYTRGLLASMPGRATGGRLQAIDGTVPAARPDSGRVRVRPALFAPVRTVRRSSGARRGRGHRGAVFPPPPVARGHGGGAEAPPYRWRSAVGLKECGRPDLQVRQPIWRITH